MSRSKEPGSEERSWHRLVGENGGGEFERRRIAGPGDREGGQIRVGDEEESVAGGRGEDNGALGKTPSGAVRSQAGGGRFDARLRLGGVEQTPPNGLSSAGHVFAPPGDRDRELVVLVAGLGVVSIGHVIAATGVGRTGAYRRVCPEGIGLARFEREGEAREPFTAEGTASGPLP